MATNQKQGKKLPKRTSAPAHKTRRQASWARGELRKARNRAAQEARHRANQASGTSPWALAKASRALVRSS